MDLSFLIYGDKDMLFFVDKSRPTFHFQCCNMLCILQFCMYRSLSGVKYLSLFKSACDHDLQTQHSVMMAL